MKASRSDGKEERDTTDPPSYFATSQSASNSSRYIGHSPSRHYSYPSNHHSNRNLATSNGTTSNGSSRGGSVSSVRVSTPFKRRSPRLQLIRQSFAHPSKHTLLEQWMTREFRWALAECIPYIVGLIWRDGVVDLHKIARIPILALAQSSQTNLYHSNYGYEYDGSNSGNGGAGKKTIWQKFFAWSVEKPHIFNTAAMVLALALARRVRILYTKITSMCNGHVKPLINDDVCNSVPPFITKAEALRVGSVQYEFTIYFVCVMLASKYTEDKPLQNESWSRVIGLSLEQVNTMEMQVLQVMQHGLYVGPAEFDRWLNCLQSVMRLDHEHHQHLNGTANDHPKNSDPPQQLSPPIHPPTPDTGDNYYQRRLSR